MKDEWNEETPTKREKKPLKISYAWTALYIAIQQIVNTSIWCLRASPPHPPLNIDNQLKRRAKPEKSAREQKDDVQTKSDVISIKWLNIYSFCTKTSQVQQFRRLFEPLKWHAFEQDEGSTERNHVKVLATICAWKLSRYESNSRASIKWTTENGKKGCIQEHIVHICSHGVRIETPQFCTNICFFLSQLTK